MTSPWRPRIGLADSVALLAASGLTITVATPLGVELGVVTPPSDLEAFEQVVDSLPVAPLLPTPEAGPWVQFTPAPAPPSRPPAALPSAPDPAGIPSSGSEPRSAPPRPAPALHQTGSSVVSTPLGPSRLSLHRADLARRSRYRASLSALQRLSRRSTVELPAGPRSATEHPIARLPLQPGRESWQATRDLVLSGHLPHPELVRAESFVAVASEGTHRSPSSTAPVGLGFELAASPEEAGTLLLQVRASGPDQLALERAPVELVLVVDTSGSMGVSGGLDEVRAAIVDILEQLQPRDRVSLVTFGGRPTVALSSTPRARLDPDTLHATLATLTADGATDAAGGVLLALTQFQRRRLARPDRHVVLLSDGDLMSVGQEAWLEAARAVRTKRAGLHTVAIGQEWAESGPLETEMARLGAHHHAVHSGREAAARLARVLGGGDAPQAEAVAMAVRFDPKRVERYELIGWQGGGAGRTHSPIPPGDLPAGSHSTALLRVTLQPGQTLQGGDSIGELLVRQVGSPGVHELPLTAPLSGLPSLDEVPDLAMAEAAAQLAEALRASDADALSAVARRIHATSRPGHPQDAAFLRVARRAANLAALPVIAPGDDPRLDVRLAKLNETLGSECFEDFQRRRGVRHGQLVARARFHHGRFAGAAVLDDQLDDRMLEACVLQRLRVWAPPPGLDGDLLLPMVWAPAFTGARDADEEG